MNRNFFKFLLPIFLLCAGIIPVEAQVLYKIDGNGLSAPSYIFGTHHLAPANFLDNFKSLPAIMESADAVVGEIDMTVNPMQMQMEMAQFMTAPQDSTLSQLMSAEEFAQLNEQFKPYSPMPGLDLQMLDGMRPMVPTTMATLVLVQKSMPGFDPNNQLDALFQKRFKEAGKKIIPLETPAQQAELLYTSTPIPTQLEALKETLAEPEKCAEWAQKMNDAYLSQNLDELLNISKSEESDPAFMIALLDRRNHDWMTRLPKIMADGSSLIVVGAGHLAGKEGLVNLLKKAGYEVTPMD